MSLYVRPHEGSVLSTWSLGDGIPVASLGGDYFVFYSRGLQATPWHFWVELTVSMLLLETQQSLGLPLSPFLYSYVRNVIITFLSFALFDRS